MKKIDLLNMISKGEKVPLIKYRDKILHWNKEKDRFEDKDGMNTLYEMDFSELNDEVEVIEDKKIEHLDIYNCFEQMGNSVIAQARLDENFTDISNKINEIIDYINGGTNGE